MKTKLSISWHKASGQFVRYCGQAIGRDGQPRPYCFYLGDDEANALGLAARIKADWLAVKSAGASSWSLSYLDSFKRSRIEREATVGVLLNGQTVGHAIATETVRQVRTAYLAEQLQRMEARQISVTFYRQLVWRLSVAVDRLPPTLAINDRAMRSIGEDDIRRVILYWASLPMGLPRNQTKKTTTGSRKANWNKYVPRQRQQGKPIGELYAKHLISALKMLFVWSHETERWDMPRRFAKLFKVKFSNVHREAERFSLDELKAIYNAIRIDRHRLWFLLGLNAGFDRMGLASLDWSMVKGLDTDHPMIERNRHKTGVYSRHLLWAETVRVLKETPASKRHGLVCLSEQGESLVVISPTSERDSIQAAWRNIIDRCEGVRKLSFGKLRKTGAWMIKIAGGLEASEMYLAHGEPGMNKHYAGRDWSKLENALTAMRSQVTPLLADCHDLTVLKSV